MKPDSNFISYVVPNYVYGRRQGLTDEETEKLAEEAYSLMQIAEEKQVPKKPVYVVDIFECPCCGEDLGNTDNTEYHCWNCGQKIDWEDKP